MHDIYRGEAIVTLITLWLRSVYAVPCIGKLAKKINKRSWIYPLPSFSQSKIDRSVDSSIRKRNGNRPNFHEERRTGFDKF